MMNSEWLKNALEIKTFTSKCFTKFVWWNHTHLSSSYELKFAGLWYNQRCRIGEGINRNGEQLHRRN